MQSKVDWSNYSQAWKRLPFAVFWLIVSLIDKTPLTRRALPKKYAFNIATAKSNFSTCIYDLVDSNNRYSKHTHGIFVGIIVGVVVGLVLTLFGG
jgi:hypothetical protein